MIFAAVILLCISLVSMIMGSYISGAGFFVAAVIMFIRSRMTGKKERKET